MEKKRKMSKANKNGYRYDFKNQSPIKFEFYQEDMEKIMYQLNSIVNLTRMHDIDFNQIKRIRDDLQHKINIYKERKEWI